MKLNSRQIEILDDRVAEVLKGKTPAERLKIAFDLWHSTTLLLPYYLKSLHPEWSAKTIQAEVTRRLSYGTV